VYFLVKVLITALVVAGVSELARRSSLLAPSLLCHTRKTTTQDFSHG
jgi:hypothetical protein